MNFEIVMWTRTFVLLPLQSELNPVFEMNLHHMDFIIRPQCKIISGCFTKPKSASLEVAV